jgi:hypothetical protein
MATYSARLAEHQGRLSARIGDLFQLVSEADFIRHLAGDEMTAFWLSVARSGKARFRESVDVGCDLQKYRDIANCFIKMHGTLGTCLNSKLRGLD